MNDVIRASLEEVARFAGENAAIGTPIETSAGSVNVDRIASLIENAPDLVRRLKGAILSR